MTIKLPTTTRWFYQNAGQTKGLDTKPKLKWRRQNVCLTGQKEHFKCTQLRSLWCWLPGDTQLSEHGIPICSLLADTTGASNDDLMTCDLDFGNLCSQPDPGESLSTARQIDIIKICPLFHVKWVKMLKKWILKIEKKNFLDPLLGEKLINNN